MTVEKLHNGHIVISDVFMNHVIKQTYVGHTKRTARKMWKELHGPYLKDKVRREG